MKKAAFVTIIIILMALQNLSCSNSPTITEIVAHPEEWQGKEVTVTGTVIDSPWETDFVIMDGKGTPIFVGRSQVCDAPPEKPANGAKVRVNGVVWISEPPLSGRIPIIMANSWEYLDANGESGKESPGSAQNLFRDPSLEASICYAIGKQIEQINESELQGLTKLYADNSGISDLSGLEYCTALTEVKLDRNQISDITPLSKLTNIHALSLINNNISDISPLLDNRGLGKGDYLYLDNNPLSQDSLNKYIPELRQRGVSVSY